MCGPAGTLRSGSCSHRSEDRRRSNGISQDGISQDGISQDGISQDGRRIVERKSEESLAIPVEP